MNNIYSSELSIDCIFLLLSIRIEIRARAWWEKRMILSDRWIASDGKWKGGRSLSDSVPIEHVLWIFSLESYVHFPEYTNVNASKII